MGKGKMITKNLRPFSTDKKPHIKYGERGKLIKNRSPTPRVYIFNTLVRWFMR